MDEGAKILESGPVLRAGRAHPHRSQLCALVASWRVLCLVGSVGNCGLRRKTLRSERPVAVNRLGLLHDRSSKWLEVFGPHPATSQDSLHRDSNGRIY